MKKTLLLLLFGTAAYAQLNIGAPNDINVCSDNFDGFGHFNLTLNNAVILQEQNPDDFSITYHEALSLAQSGEHPITTPENYNSATSVLYVRVTEIKDPSNYLVEPFYIRAAPKPTIPQIPTQYVSGNNPVDGLATINLTLLNDIVLQGNTPDGMEISYYTTLADAQDGISAIKNTESYTTPSIILYVRIESVITTCISVAEFNIVVNSPETEEPVPDKKALNDSAFTALTYYPNPVIDILSIKNTEDINTITVTNSVGQTVITKTINSPENNINFSNFRSGVYFVNISGEGKSKTFKIIKK